MPGAVIEGNELFQLTPSINHDMRGYTQTFKISKATVLTTVQLAGEQPLGGAGAVLTFRQRDAVHDHQLWPTLLGPRIKMRTRVP